MLNGKHVLLGVTGGIAAYKSAELIRLFIKAGCHVKVIMTKHATEFITPLTLQTLSGNPVFLDMFSLIKDHDIAHIALAEEADILVIAPATANVIGKMAGGLADDLLTTVALATKAPILICPAETWDGYLNDINGDHVTHAHVRDAVDHAACGPIDEGSVGGGTGMNCYGFKGGTGSASRQVSFGGERYTVGVLLQCNFGSRTELRWNGISIGSQVDVPCPMEATDWFQEERRSPQGAGSVIAIVATDVPLLPGQAKALARRVPFGLARTGTSGSHFSGDIFLAFSTANSGALNSGFPDHPAESAPLDQMTFVPWGYMDPIYEAVVQGVEEAVMNSLVANEDMTGRNGHFSPALPHDQLTALLKRSRTSA